MEDKTIKNENNGTRALKSKKEHQKSLPRKRISAGCLLFDEQGRLLIVRPTYKSTWEIPGGVVESKESPRKAAQREIKEELGLLLKPVRLLGIDYGRENKKRTERLQFIFLGPTLTAANIGDIRLPKVELSEYRLLPAAEALKLLNNNLAMRVKICLECIESGRIAYSENQNLVLSGENVP